MSVWGLPLFSRFIRYVQHDSGEFVLTTWSKLYVTSASEKQSVIITVKTLHAQCSHSSKSCIDYSTNCRTSSVAYCQGYVVPSILEMSLVSCVWSSVVVESAAAWSSQGQCSGLRAGGWEHSNIRERCYTSFLDSSWISLLSRALIKKIDSDKLLDPNYCSWFILTWTSPSNAFFFEDDSLNTGFTFEPDVCLRQN